MPDIILPTEDSEPEQKNPKLLILYGQEKIGKTTIVSQLPQGTYLNNQCDRNGEGADYIKCRKVKIRTYDDLINTSIEVIKQGRPYTYGVLDTATSFEDLCEIDATKQYRLSNAGKNFQGRSVLELVGPDYNPGYKWLRLSFLLAMSKLYDAYPHVIIICHLKDKFLRVEEKDKGKSNSSVSASEIDLSGKLRGKLAAAADATGYLYRTVDGSGNQKLWVDFRTNELVNCGTRCPHLIQKNFEFNWDKIYIK